MVAEKFSPNSESQQKERIISELNDKIPGLQFAVDEACELSNNPPKAKKQIYENWLRYKLSFFTTANTQYNNLKIFELAKEYIEIVLGLEIIEGGPMNVVDTRIPDDIPAARPKGNSRKPRPGIKDAKDARGNTFSEEQMRMMVESARRKELREQKRSGETSDENE